DILDQFEKYMHFLQVSPGILPWDMEAHDDDLETPSDTQAKAEALAEDQRLADGEEALEDAAAALEAAGADTEEATDQLQATAESGVTPPKPQKPEQSSEHAGRHSRSALLKLSALEVTCSLSRTLLALG